MSTSGRLVVIGGGIVGLAIADRLRQDRPSAQVTVLEKETGWARHQTGRNSGVIHSGLYYPPGSLKARMCRAGAESMVAFAEEHGISYRICGKLVVAVRSEELAGLRRLHQRGLANGLAVRELSAAEAAELEPNISSVGALHVPETGVIDYGQVCRALVQRLAEGGATLRTSAEVLGARRFGTSIVLQTTAGDVGADVVVNCAGLQNDLVARRLGHRPSVRIVPFRGEYRTVAGPSADLLRGLVYPVPDPDFPFLGVHLTRGLDGQVHAGPNAVLAMAREGYSWGRVRPIELAGTLSYAGFWRLAGQHWRSGATEMARSLSAHRFAEAVRRLLPGLRDVDLESAPAGVRAQAVRPDGGLVDDFLIERSPGVVHILNAPSPAATAAFEIAKHVAGLVQF